MGKTILQAKQINYLLTTRQQCALATTELYLLGSKAGAINKDLEAMIYEAAEHLNAARLILSDAVLTAAADRETSA